MAPENLTKRILHPQGGLLTFTYNSLWLAPRFGARLLSYTPVDDRTTQVLQRFERAERPLSVDCRRPFTPPGSGRARRDPR